MKELKLKDIKKALDKLSPQQLNKPAFYYCKDFNTSGTALSFNKAKTNLYYDGSEDPSALKTKSELLENGLDKEEIEEMEIEIAKGEFYFNI